MAKNIWYIDFDSTLYDTNSLIFDMLNALATALSELRNIDAQIALAELNNLFNKDNIDNIYNLCKYLEIKYSLPNGKLKIIIDNILENGSKYVYPDSKDFLRSLNDNGYRVQLLSAAGKRENLEYQSKKINHSSLLIYFDNTIITAVPKYTLDLRYENGIFVDDNPRDLQGLYNAGANHLLRIKRPNARYSNIQLSIPNIKEYTALSEILYIKEEERNHDG